MSIDPSPGTVGYPSTPAASGQRPSEDWRSSPPSPPQLPLFEELQEITPLPGETLEERFRRFHALNPHVYRSLRHLAYEERGAGITRGSINRLYEVLRHRQALETRGDPWKLNNSYRSFYARLLMQSEPNLSGWFETRRLAPSSKRRKKQAPPDHQPSDRHERTEHHGSS